jgi:hypothetical protein
VLPDGGLVVRDLAEGADSWRLFLLDRASGALEPFFHRDNASVSAVHDPWTRRIVGAGWANDSSMAYCFQPDLQGVNEKLTTLFPNDAVSGQVDAAITLTRTEAL